MLRSCLAQNARADVSRQNTQKGFHAKKKKGGATGLELRTYTCLHVLRVHD